MTCFGVVVVVTAVDFFVVLAGVVSGSASVVSSSASEVGASVVVVVARVIFTVEAFCVVACASSAEKR